MNEYRSGADAPVKLVDAAPFALGAMRVEPSCREVEIDGARRAIEPRVMQVLVALAAARGAVVSRTALVESCWDSRAVSDDAVQRCIAALRRLSQESGGAFEINTVPRVGYRLIAATAEPNAGAALSSAAAAESGASAPSGSSAVSASVASHAGGNGFRFASLAATLLLAAVGAAAAASRASTPAPLLVVGPFEAHSATPTAGELSRAIPASVANDLSAAGVSIIIHGAPEDGAAGSRRAPRAAYRVAGSIMDATEGVDVIARIETAGGEIILSKAIAVEDADISKAPAIVAAALGAALTGPVDLFRANRGVARTLPARLRVADFLRENRGLDALDEAERLLAAGSRDAAALILYAHAVAIALPDIAPADRERLLLRGRAAANRAVAAVPDDGAAFSALAMMLPASDYSGRLAILEKGLARDVDNAQLQRAYGQVLVSVGRLREAAHWHGRSLAGDPFSDNQLNSAILVYMDSGSEYSANKLLSRARAQRPDHNDGLEIELALALRSLNADRFDDALARLKSMTAYAPAMIVRLDIMAEAIRAKTPEAAARLAENCLAPALARAGFLHYCAYAAAGIGDNDSAFTMIDGFIGAGRVADSRAARDAQFLEAPWAASKTAILFRRPFAAMRVDARMWRIFDRTGLVDYWLESGEWPDFCSYPAPQVDCRAMASAAIGGRAPPLERDGESGEPLRQSG